jgi:hypothetical protein
VKIIRDKVDTAAESGNPLNMGDEESEVDTQVGDLHT